MADYPQLRYLLDADWIIQAHRGYGNANTLLQRLAPSNVGVIWITVAEVYEGAYNSPNPNAHINRYRAFLMPYEKVGTNEPIAVRFGELRSFLRRQGRMISDGDIFLAATALHYDLTVLTYNLRHFERVPDLKLFVST